MEASSSIDDENDTLQRKEFSGFDIAAASIAEIADLKHSGYENIQKLKILHSPSLKSPTIFIENACIP